MKALKESQSIIVSGMWQLQKLCDLACMYFVEIGLAVLSMGDAYP